MHINKILNKIETDFQGQAIEYGKCKYKTDDGKKCAIGLFMPEGHEGEMSNAGVSDLLNQYPDLNRFMPSYDMQKLVSFQRAHDEGYEYGANNLNNSCTISEEELKLFLQFVACDLFA